MRFQNMGQVIHGMDLYLFMSPIHPAKLKPLQTFDALLR